MISLSKQEKYKYYYAAPLSLCIDIANTRSSVERVGLEMLERHKGDRICVVLCLNKNRPLRILNPLMSLLCGSATTTEYSEASTRQPLSYLAYLDGDSAQCKSVIDVLQEAFCDPEVTPRYVCMEVLGCMHALTFALCSFVEPHYFINYK